MGNQKNIGSVGTVIIEPKVYDKISSLRADIQSLLAELPNVQTGVEVSLTSKLHDDGRWKTKVSFGNASDPNHLETEADMPMYGLLPTEQFAIQRYVDSVWRDLAPTLRRLVHSLACTRAIEKSMQILREVPKGYVHLGRVLYDTMLIVGDPNDLERELATHRLYESDRRQMGPQVTGPPTGLIHSLIERIHESTRTCEWDANVHAGGPFPFERT